MLARSRRKNFFQVIQVCEKPSSWVIRQEKRQSQRPTEKHRWITPSHLYQNRKRLWRWWKLRKLQAPRRCMICHLHRMKSELNQFSVSSRLFVLLRMFIYVTPEAWLALRNWKRNASWWRWCCGVAKRKQKSLRSHKYRSIITESRSDVKCSRARATREASTTRKKIGSNAVSSLDSRFKILTVQAKLLCKAPWTRTLNDVNPSQWSSKWTWSGSLSVKRIFPN